MLLRKIKNIYQDEMDDLTYTEHGRLTTLLCTVNWEEYEGHTGVACFTMMEEGSPKFRDELMEAWIANIFQMVLALADLVWNP